MRISLPGTELSVHPLCLGGNVFGASADQDQSFEVMDAYQAAGGNFIDTADSYLWRLPGNSGGESETIIGNWLTARGNRADIVVATKVGSWPVHPGLSAENIAVAAEESLRRLRTDYIDLYYAHRDDPDTPLEETLSAFDALVRAGKVRYIAASNYSAPRLAEALRISAQNGFASYVAVQPHYNLMERDYEHELAPLLAERGLPCLPYFSLAMGFLTGKYKADTTIDSWRAEGARQYLTDRGRRVLAELAAVAEQHQVGQAAVALAWLLAQPTVATPLASARNIEQLAGLLPMAELKLSDDELHRLTAASEPISESAGH
ncbi:MAG TPA: aldo/keto reductase [Pseudonocardia sp.]|jgi:aryl-alcohol dehydrogenase-like predicted oxidoreductase|uniref:aldo/keto reductase n=1 Tax=Pseudonocardia sp. TaxID=60912 RepID=UPI002C38248E|nr:aldo/keto reductase [Pseudonocardia sp.]HTF49339.1 aldo/keto reductase [Pseudonocardia sp.]